MSLFPVILIVIAALMGAAGVALAAMAAHAGDAARLGPASSLLLFHAPAVLAVILLAEQALVRPLPGRLSAAMLAAGALLFAGDLVLRHFAGRGLFPMAAPSGGTLMILGWLMLGLAALASRMGIG